MKAKWKRQARNVLTDGEVFIFREYLALTNTVWWKVYQNADGTKPLRAFLRLKNAKAWVEFEALKRLKEQGKDPNQ